MRTPVCVVILGCQALFQNACLHAQAKLPKRPADDDENHIRLVFFGRDWSLGGHVDPCCRVYMFSMPVLAQTRAGDEGLRHEVTEVMDGMVAAGLTVLRFWAFCDGERWNSLQPSPGKAAFHSLTHVYIITGATQGNFDLQIKSV